MHVIDQVIRVAGMKRNGNHGIVNWILAQYSGNAVFCNALHGTESLNTLRSDPIEAFTHNPLLTKVELASPCDKRVLILTFEDHPVGGVIESKPPVYYERNLGHQVRQESNLAILRDPFNFFASRIQAELNGTYPRECWGDCFSKGDDQKIWTKWKSYARRFLEFSARSSSEFLAVSYNHWTVSLEYRRSICDSLGIPLLNDEERKVVTGWGAGSSFNEGMWQEPSIYSNRWKNYLHHPSLLNATRDEELVSLAKTIFHDVLDVDEIVLCVAAQACHGTKIN
jgi:hypothetical protein